MRHFVPLVLALVLAVPAQAAPGFDPVTFFRGHSHGDGQLKIIFQSTKPISVDSEGTAERDGSLLLTQKVHEQGQPSRTRYWRLKQFGPHRFGGTLTDAAGPVSVEMIGNRTLIRYTMKNNMTVEQWLTPAGPGVVRNAMKIRRFGFVVAHFNETIRKLD